MGECLYFAARVMMWLCFVLLPFSPFLFMIHDPVLRFTLFGIAIAISLILLFTGCSMKIYNHWKEQEIEKLVESSEYTVSTRTSVQYENSTEMSTERLRTGSLTPLNPPITDLPLNGAMNFEDIEKATAVTFALDKNTPVAVEKV